MIQVTKKKTQKRHATNTSRNVSHFLEARDHTRLPWRRRSDRKTKRDVKETTFLSTTEIEKEAKKPPMQHQRSAEVEKASEKHGGSPPYENVQHQRKIEASSIASTVDPRD